jgi:hypothetical protein
MPDLKSEFLAAQVAIEKQAIDNAPKMPIQQLMPQSGKQGRCIKCGRVSRNLVLMDTVHGQERWVGRECCGGRHG